MTSPPPRDRFTTFRVVDIPLENNRKTLKPLLQRVLGLDDKNKLIIRSLAVNAIRDGTKIATMDFEQVPDCLQGPQPNGGWRFQVEPGDDDDDDDDVYHLLVDTLFLGLTTLASPPSDKHTVDIIAVSGLGGHAYGSFKQAGERFMWLRDALPMRMNGARVMIYGHNSTLLNSNSFQDLEALGHAFHNTLRAIKPHANAPKILIGHSLGGLIIKQAVTHINDLDNAHPQGSNAMLEAMRGILFFGVPNHGMDIESLLPMVSGQPNELFLRTLGTESQLLRDQCQRFNDSVAPYPQLEVVCYYETQTSLTAKKDSAGKWRPCGPRKILVASQSARHGRRCESGSNVDSIDRAHQHLVNFGPLDDVLDRVLNKLRELCDGSYVSFSSARTTAFHQVDDAILAGQLTQGVSGSLLRLPSTIEVENDTSLPPIAVSTMPFGRDKHFVGRIGILDRITSLHKEQPRVGIHGLAGIGKSQIAIEYAYRHRDVNPKCHLFWVYAASAERFVQSFHKIATACQIPGYNDHNEDILELVLQWLSKEQHGVWLLVIDNVDDIRVLLERSSNVASRRRLLDYVPTFSHGRVLATSRSRLAAGEIADYQHLCEVFPMDYGEGEDLVKSRLCRPLIASEDMRQLIDALDYIPAALCQACAYLNQHPTISIERYTEKIKNDSSILQRPWNDLRRDMTVPNAVLDVFALSFSHIEDTCPLAATLLSVMVQFDRQGVPKILIEALRRLDDEVFDSDDFKFEEGLSRLLDYSLIASRDDYASFDTHSLVQVAVKTWCNSRGKLPDIQRLALLAMAKTVPSGDIGNWTAWTALSPHVAAIVDSDWIELVGQSDDDVVLSHSESITLQALEKILRNSALYSKSLGDYELTERRQKQSLALSLRTRGHQSQLTLRNMTRLARTYSSQGRWAEAQKLLLEVLDRRKRVLGPKHLSTLKAMVYLASTYHGQGRLVEAEALLVEVVETYKKILGIEHPDTLKSLRFLAATYRSQGRLVEAEALVAEVVETYKRILGHEHPDTLAAMMRLAASYRIQGRLAEAEALSLEVVETQRRVLGPEHSNTLASMAVLAATCKSQGRLAEAEALALEVVDKGEEDLGH